MTDINTVADAITTLEPDPEPVLGNEETTLAPCVVEEAGESFGTELFGPASFGPGSFGSGATVAEGWVADGSGVGVVAGSDVAVGKGVVESAQVTTRQGLTGSA